MDEHGISVEDALRVIEVFNKALEYRPLIRRAILGNDFLNLSHEERINETLTPRIALHYFDEAQKIPCLFFRFVGDGSPLVEALFYPIESIYAYLDEARYHLRRFRTPEQSDEEVENAAFDHAVDMALIMIDNFYQRARLMMDSFTMEVITQWRIQNKRRVAHYYAARGESVPRQKDTSLENAVTDYTKQVIQLWNYQGQTQENWRKLLLVEEYEVVYKHWNRLSKMLSEDDWREYAKAGKFQDAPDDLLDKLENTDRSDNETVENKVCGLALEHAARRVGLIKKHSVSEAVTRMRKNGVRATGYTSTQLFSFRKEGRELAERIKMNEAALAQDKTTESLEQNGDSAQIEKAKSFEQKVKLIQAKLEKSVEQKGTSAQLEIT